MVNKKRVEAITSTLVHSLATTLVRPLPQVAGVILMARQKYGLFPNCQKKEQCYITLLLNYVLQHNYTSSGLLPPPLCGCVSSTLSVENLRLVASMPSPEDLASVNMK